MTYDLAIIGAGVMGLFTADFASRRGASVLLLDQWRIGDPRAASFRLTRSIRGPTSWSRSLTTRTAAS